MLRLRSSAFALAASVTLALSSACGGGAPAPNAAGAGKADAPTGDAAERTAAAADAPPGGPPKDVDCGDFTTCAIASDGLVHCWGRDKGGELGDGAGKGERVKRGLVPGIGKVRKVALASQFGCAILEDKKVKCWGTGHLGSPGKPAIASKPMSVPGIEGVEELVASGAVACARGSHDIACWGSDEKTIGTPPKGTFTQIAAGFTHACALDRAGAVTCWGQGEWGGKGAYSKPAVTGAVQVVTGDRHGCVVTKEKTVKCWGMNDAGQLGTKSDVESHKKVVAIAGISNVTKLVAGEASTCALLADGSVRCWGSNGEGELGLGRRTPDERPSRITSLSNVEQVCLASAHGCALTKEGKLLCWGSNAFGQLGDGTKDRRQAPTAVEW